MTATQAVPGSTPTSRDGAATATAVRDLAVDDVTVVDKKSLRTALVGAGLGNLMEWYDFGIYGYLAATMETIFVPHVAAQWRLVVVLATFAVSFLVRPLGGLVFGPLGDKIGRQRTLAITMITMSLATGAIGLLPSFATIGWWAFVGLVACRMIQGFSTGGEYAGATTFAAEYAPDQRRGRYASLLDIGSYLGFAFGAGAVALLTALWGHDTMLAWGWRVPFLLAIPFGIAALLFRMRVDESPAFESTSSVNEAAGTGVIDESQRRLGVLGILRHHWRPLLIAMALVGATNTAGYALTSYMPSYLETTHGYSTLGAALATIPALVILSALIPFVGRLSDRVGRKPIYAMGVITSLVLTLPAYWMMANRSLVYVAMMLLAISVLCYISVSAPTLPALFPTSSRYGAMAISYNIAVSLFGGTAPMFSQLLVKLTGNSLSPAFYTMFFAALGGLALFGMKESARKPLPGSMPTVESEAEAHELVETQHENPDIVHEELPFEAVDAAKERDEAGQFAGGPAAPVVTEAPGPASPDTGRVRAVRPRADDVSGHLLREN